MLIIFGMFYAADLDLEDTFSLDEDFPQSEQKWANYVRGVVKFIQERCPQFKQGADLVISGNVPHFFWFEFFGCP